MVALDCDRQVKPRDQLRVEGRVVVNKSDHWLVFSLYAALPGEHEHDAAHAS